MYIHKYRLGAQESRFIELMWEATPLTTREMTELCAEKLNWARTTTYTILKKFCERGVLDMTNSRVTVLMDRDTFYALQSEEFVDTSFGGSLPAFIAAFTKRKALSEAEVAEIQKLLEAYKEA